MKIEFEIVYNIYWKPDNWKTWNIMDKKYKDYFMRK